MEQDVFTNKEEQINDILMTDKENQQSSVNAKEKIKVNYYGSGIAGLSAWVTFIKVLAIVYFIIAFVGFIMFTVVDDSPFAFCLIIVGIIAGVNCFVMLPFIRGFRTIVRKALYQSALLEKDYDFE